MLKHEDNSHYFILLGIRILLFAMCVALFFIPPALFPDPANGLHVLRSMHMGSAFNTFTAPDQDDISQNYDQFLTWWSPGQYLVPYAFGFIGHINMGIAISATVVLANAFGLAGFIAFFKKIGFSPLVAMLSALFIICQVAFVVPYVFYNGGEVLLFAFEGWFLYGCVAIKKPGVKLLLFVLLSSWIGFFCKSSFIWIYAAGLICLWVRLSNGKTTVGEWIKKGLWIGIPAVLSIAVIYITFLSKGESPATSSLGLKIGAATFTFPLSTPLLSAFSLDDLFHGILFNFGKPMFSYPVSIAIVIVLAVLSVILVRYIIRHVNNPEYRLFLVVFYAAAFLFFSVVYLRQLNVSYEARHFRIIGLLVIPGMIFLILKAKLAYRLPFILVCLGIAYFSYSYVVKGFVINHKGARGVTGIAQPNIDQPSLNHVLQLDRQNKNAVFVFVNNDIGLEISHNRVITLPPIAGDLKIDINEYKYNGFAGPLFIVLPETYNGPKEKMIMKSFPGYTGFNVSMLSDKYVLYEARMRR